MSDEKDKLDILKEIFGTAYRSGEEWLFHCPKCNHHKPKLSVNIGKNVWKCWTCSYRGNSLYRLVRKHGSFLQRQAWEQIAEVVDLSVSLYEEIFKDDESKKVKETLDLPKEFVPLSNKYKPISAKKPLKYLKERGITKQDINKWKIGYCSRGEYNGRIIIPSFDDNGNANYYIARSYTDDWKKYKNPPKVSKDIVFNELYIDWKNDLVIVEGVFDAIKAGNAVPLLQCSMGENSRLFQEIVKHDTPIYVALDPEAEKEALSLIRKLMEYEVEVYKIDVTGFEDVGAMTKEEFQLRKEQAVPMSVTSYLENLFAEGDII